MLKQSAGILQAIQRLFAVCLLFLTVTGCNRLAANVEPKLTKEHLDMISAIKADRREDVKRLIGQGRDSDSKGKLVGALWLASVIGRPGIAQMALDMGADVNAKTTSGETALKRAQTK